MRSTAFKFASQIEMRIEALPAAHLHTRPRSAKRLLEELYPLSRFALLLKQPGLQVDVQAYENSGRGDGHIWIAGFHADDFDVEITFAGYGAEDALRSALLAEKGFAPGAGPIKRDKKTGKIIATMEAQDLYEPIKLLAMSICERTRVKAEKSYALGTVLVVAFEDLRLRGYGWWQLLHNAIAESGGLERGSFKRIYLFNCCTNEFQQVA